MLQRSFALTLSIVGILYSGWVSALGLGEITLKSQYNQPLNAEIRLLKVRDLSEEEILVSLASPDDFNRAGVERIFFLTGLQFEVVLNNPSYPFIRVTSRKPITEPYLNFLVETQWPSGRLLREYTLLLDLPVFSGSSSSSSSVSAPSTVRSTAPIQRSTNQYSSNTSGSSSSAPVSRSSSSSYSQSSVDSYRVQRGDTLWEIAESVRPGSSVTIHQTMIALQQANPQAFIDGNINRLKNGQVLRVPDANEITGISYNQAVSAVRSQNQSWSSDASTKAVLTSAAPVTAPVTSSATPEGRLTLGSADLGQGDVRAAGASGAGQALQKELSEAQEELSRSSRENAELKSRVNDLESQIETMEKLIQVTNDQLKALQLASQNTSQAVDEAAQELSSDVASVDPLLTEEINEQASEISESVNGLSGDNEIIDPVLTDDVDIDESLVDESVVEKPVVEEAPAEVTPAPVVTPIQTSSGFDLITFIKDNLLAVGGILLALLAGILLLFRMREKPEATDSDFDSFDLGDESDLIDLDDNAVDELSDETDYGLDDDDTIEAQTEDVVAEADIYVSLGQEEKAVELLEKEIQQNPENADARLGLLKIFAKSQNVSAFDEQYAQLLPLGNVVANDQAMGLRKEIDNAEPFDTDQYSVAPDSEDAFDSLNLDEDMDSDLDLADDIDPLDSLAESQSNDDTLDNELDLNLDMGDVSLDLDDAASDLDDLELELGEDSLSFSESDVDLELDLDEVDTPSSPVDEMASELDKLDDDKSLDDLEFSIDSDFEKTLDGLDDGLTIEEDVADASDIEFDLNFDEIEADLDLDSVDKESVDIESVDIEGDLDDALDLDSPPTDDLDLASLDDEIAAMTADIEANDNDSLDEKADEQSLELDIDSDLDLDSDTSLTEDLEDLANTTLGDDLSLDGETDLSEMDGLNLADTADLSAPTDAEDPFAGAELDLDELAEEVDTDAAESITLDDVENPFDEDVQVLENAEEDLDILAAGEIDGSEVDDDKTQLVDDLESDSSADTPVSTEDDELSFLEASDEVSTKLDLARAYIDMGDTEGAEDILNEVIEEGSEEQKTEAELILKSL